MVYHRKLWALHLDPFLPDIAEIVRTFLLSSANALQQMLRRVCAQLADISAPLAILITRQVSGGRGEKGGEERRKRRG